MKKNKFLRLASILMMACLMTTCVISGTFAKYTTADSASDTAHGAKWGISLKVDGDDVLYNEDKAGNEVTGLKVEANDLAAPGTYQKLATVALTGQPEVAYEIKVDVSLELTGWMVDGDEYCPLVFTVDGTQYKIDNTITTVDKLEEAIEVAIINAITGASETTSTGTFTKGFNAGEAVPDTANQVLIDWTWAFAGDDAKDTKLGNAAAGGSPATIDFSLAVDVTQVN